MSTQHEEYEEPPEAWANVSLDDAPPAIGLVATNSFPLNGGPGQITLVGDRTYIIDIAGKDYLVTPDILIHLGDEFTVATESSQMPHLGLLLNRQDDSDGRPSKRGLYPMIEACLCHLGKEPQVIVLAEEYISANNFTGSVQRSVSGK